ncbi:MAG TPA: hypothetical protein VFW29_01735 [Solirubrobacteraceae bacterium]|nr:hypothetical protein [Solirubrobacteraceae bacterium]
MRSSWRDTRELTRGSGAMLLATGALVALIREASGGSWNDFDRMLVILAPAILLYLLALELERPGSVRRGGPGGAIQLVIAVLLTPVALELFLTWSGAGHGNLVSVVLFALTALLAAVGALRIGVPYAMLLSALFALVAWLLLWDLILGHPSTGTVRWLLAVGSALMLATGIPLARGDRLGGAEIAIAGGIGAIGAGAIGVVVGAVDSVFAQLGGDRLLHFQTNGAQHFGWDLYLVIVSVGLGWLGSRLRVRGLGYVGGAGLAVASLSVGLRITHLEHGGSIGHDLGTWPIVLVAVGLLALLAPPFFARE